MYEEVKKLQKKLKTHGDPLRKHLTQEVRLRRVERTRLVRVRPMGDIIEDTPKWYVHVPRVRVSFCSTLIVGSKTNGVR